jgi:DNA-binding Lrp family transcriptional regulator
MIKLDLKDRKILFYLIHDSRQSFKSIGKKIGVSKESAHYRINRLIKNEIIRNFTLMLNFRRFGYSIMMTFYKFNNINPSIKKEIIDFFVKNKLTFYVSLIEGTSDFQVDFFMGNPTEFERLMDEIREKYWNYLSFQNSLYYISGNFYNYCFLLDETVNTTQPYHWHWGEGLVDIDKLDFQILSELAKNTRMPIKDIANNVNSTINKVNYRLKKLNKEKASGTYTINVDWEKIGYRWFHLQVSLRDYRKKKQIAEYIGKNPNLIRSFKFLNLNMDLHFTFLLNNMEQLRKIVEGVTAKFPDSINNYYFYSTFKIYKHHYMIPELLEIKNPLNKEN